MTHQESISDLNWNNYRGLFDAGHIDSPLAPGGLDGLSSCEIIDTDQFDGYAPLRRNILFPLQFHQSSNGTPIERDNSAQGYREFADTIPARLDAGIRSVDMDTINTDGIPNGETNEPNLEQKPRHSVVNSMQGAHGPWADITLLFFIEWQEYLPGGLALDSEHVCGVEVKGKTLIWKDGLMHELLQLPCVAENLLQDATMGRARVIIEKSLDRRRYLAFSIRTATVDLHSPPQTIPAHFSQCVPETIRYLEAQELNACFDSRCEHARPFSVARSSYVLDSYQSTDSRFGRSSKAPERGGSFNAETRSTEAADKLNVSPEELDEEIKELISGLSSRVYSETRYRPRSMDELYRQVLKRVNGKECRDVLSKWLEPMGRRKHSPYLERPDFWPEWISYTAPKNLKSDCTKDIMLFILRGEHGCEVPFEKLNGALKEVRHVKPENRETLQDMISIRIAEISRPDVPFYMFL